MFEEMADNDKARFQREKAEYNMNPNGRFKHSRFDLICAVHTHSNFTEPSFQVKAGSKCPKTAPMWVHVLLGRGAWKGVHLFPKLSKTSFFVCLR